MQVLIVVAALLAWCVLPFPLALVVGRSFRAGGAGV